MARQLFNMRTLILIFGFVLLVGISSVAPKPSKSKAASSLSTYVNNQIWRYKILGHEGHANPFVSKPEPNKADSRTTPVNDLENEDDYDDEYDLTDPRPTVQNYRSLNRDIIEKDIIMYHSEEDLENKKLFLRHLKFILMQIDKLCPAEDNTCDLSAEAKQLAKAIILVIDDLGAMLKQHHPACYDKLHQDAFLMAMEHYFDSNTDIVFNNTTKAKGTLRPVIATAAQTVMKFCIQELVGSLGQFRHVLIKEGDKTVDSFDIKQYSVEIDPLSPGSRMTKEKFQVISVLEKRFNVIGLLPEKLIGMNFGEKFASNLRKTMESCKVLQAAYEPRLTLYYSYLEYFKKVKTKRPIVSHEKYLQLCKEMNEHTEEFLNSIKSEIKAVADESIGQLDLMLEEMDAKNKEPKGGIDAAKEDETSEKRPLTRLGDLGRRHSDQTSSSPDSGGSVTELQTTKEPSMY